MLELNCYDKREIYSDGKFLYNCGIYRSLCKGKIVEKITDVRLIGVLKSTNLLELPTHFKNKKIASIDSITVYEKSYDSLKSIDDFTKIPVVVNGTYYYRGLWLEDYTPDSTYLIPTNNRPCIKLKLGKVHLKQGVFKGQLLKEVEFSESPCEIPTECFCECNFLERVILSESTRRIKSYAFAYCSSLRSIFLPESVTEIDAYAFSNSSLDFIVLPPRIEKIKQYTFSECIDLKYIIIPPSVTSISECAFYGCSKLKIIALTGSFAQTFAKEKMIEFEPLESLAEEWKKCIELFMI